MLRPRSNYYERSRAPCSGPGRVIVAWTCAGSTRSWHRATSVTCYHDSGVRWHMSVVTVIAIITAVQYLENNPGLNDCENKSKLCTSGAALMIINKHFKRAALTMSGQLLAGYYWAVNGQHNEYTNPFKPSDLEFWYIYVLAALLLHLIYSQNCFKCLEDNITVHKATLLFVDIQIHNTRRTTCDQNK